MDINEHKLAVLPSLILMIRGEKVMLDLHLAKLYGVETRILKQQVKRNLKRFPADFMFELNKEESLQLVSHFVIPDLRSLGGAKPYAFTEQGVAMLSTVLRSDRAIEVNIAIMRTFVQLRKMMEDNHSLRAKIEKLENKYDEQFQVVFTAIKQLLVKKNEPRRRIGFKIKENEE